jgi:hypothetical protein
MNDCESAQKAAKFKADDQTSIFKRQNRTPTFFVFIAEMKTAQLR